MIDNYYKLLIKYFYVVIRKRKLGLCPRLGPEVFNTSYNRFTMLLEILQTFAMFYISA